MAHINSASAFYVLSQKGATGLTRVVGTQRNVPAPKVVAFRSLEQALRGRHVLGRRGKYSGRPLQLECVTVAELGSRMCAGEVELGFFEACGDRVACKHTWTVRRTVTGAECRIHLEAAFAASAYERGDAH